jgi:hypothetical protein
VTIASYQWPVTEAGEGVGMSIAGEPTPAPMPAAQLEAPDSTNPAVDASVPRVTMRFPGHGEAVDQFTDMMFDVSGRVPAGYTPIAYVRDPLRQYWSFGSIAAKTPKRVQVGTQDDRRGEFEIGVWITNQDPRPGAPFVDPPANIGHASSTVVRW